MHTRHSRPHPLGVHARDGGVDVAVLAAHADRVQFCLIDRRSDDGSGDGRQDTVTERRIDLPHHTHGVWHGFVPDVAIGQTYGFRVHGPWDPVRGHRHNPAKLLLDPYARAIALPESGKYREHREHRDHREHRLAIVPELFGHVVGSDLTGDPGLRDPRDSAHVAPLGVVHAGHIDWGDDALPRVPWADTVVYEAHVKGLTQRLPGVPDHLRGTYAGLGHPATIEYLVGLGVTTVELLPVHAIADEPALAARGVPNYWGYSTLSFFAPHPGYATGTDPLSVVTEFATMVKALHAAGLEVVLDVVYNHTCEGGQTGPTLSWRGLDAATYYRLDNHGEHVDTTGCGNSLDFREPRVIQLALDSLRYWVQELHVDGFRFDLAPTLARGRDGYDPEHAFLMALRTDPVLADIKLIAEPWDLGPQGWRTGQFPAPFAEWNDRFRDGLRDFWLIDTARLAHHEHARGVRDLATRLAGSADLFAADRGPLASINFVTAHDGFTLADTGAYNVKHNEGNGEDNRDGTQDNHSWNHGVEGPTTDPAVLAARHRSIRNLLGTVLLATGVPMLVAGDEFGRSQQGNNNAYCRDDPLTWIDWSLEPWQHDLLETTRHLLRVRREHPVLRQDRFFAGRPVHADGTKDLAWFGPDGTEMDHDRWHDPDQRVLQMYLHSVVVGPDGHHQDGSVLIVICGAAHDVQLQLPDRVWGEHFDLVWDSAFAAPPGRPNGPPAVSAAPSSTVTMSADSVRVYRVPPTPVS